MSVQNRQYISLDECINAYIDESEQSNHKYFKLWNLAFRATTELGLDFFYTVKSVKLPINANLTVNLPSDYMNYTKVGVLNSQGEIIPLTYNTKLTTFADMSPNRIGEATQDNTLYNLYSPSNTMFYNWWNNGAFSILYGVPSGAPFVGNFKIDNAKGIILLDEHFYYPYIMLEYIAQPVEGTEIQVPIQFKEAIIAYLSWKDIKSMPTTRKGSLGDKRDRRNDYYNERRLAIARYSPIYLEEAYQASQEQTRFTVKI